MSAPAPLSYAAREVFTPLELASFGLACAVVRVLETHPEWLAGAELRCHELARVVHALLQPSSFIEIVDGKFGLVEHSWIILGRPQRIGASILDVYAVGALPMVQLIDAMSIGVRRRGELYREGATRTDINRALVSRLVHAFRMIKQ